MADEATPVVEQDTAETETTEQEPQEGAEQEPTDDGDKFDPSKALEKIRKLNSEAANLRKRVKEAEGKAADTGEKDDRIKALEAENLRIRIGARCELPEELIDRLKGDTEEEILADAEKLLKLVTPAKRPPTAKPTERLSGGGDPTAEPEETDISKLGARMFRR